MRRPIQVSLSRVPLLIIGTAVFSILTIFVVKTTLKKYQIKLNPTLSNEDLWRIYRWSSDPYRRREAALILVGESRNAPLRNRRLLIGQAWGNGDLSPIVLKFQAKNYKKLGKSLVSNKLWKSLFDRFSDRPISADAYYVLGKEKPILRKLLMEKYPSHPAALASALEHHNFNYDSFGALHLSKWGVRWHGAELALNQACNNKYSFELKDIEKRQISYALSLLGHPNNALNCLNGIETSSLIKLSIAKALFKQDIQMKSKAKELLMDIIKEDSFSAEAKDAMNFLSLNYELNDIEIASLPDQLLYKSIGFHVAKIRNNKSLEDLSKFIKRWPDNHLSWELQWDFTRSFLLQNRWDQALEVIKLIPKEDLPITISSRNRFWKGFIYLKQKKLNLANKEWKELISESADNYYTFLAKRRLGMVEISLLNTNNSILNRDWMPLYSGDDLVDKLWRLGLTNEAWEIWRTRKLRLTGQPITNDEKLVEGRLRVAVGDYWMGLHQLSQLSISTLEKDVEKLEILNRSLHPFRFLPEFEAASKISGVSRGLLLSIAKQESRFSPGVESVAGAIGLMQIMPSTANYVSGQYLNKSFIKEPLNNISLASKYLAELIKRWEGNPWLVVASYNAGPGIVAEWMTSEIELEPELWVERIVYPETRIYTKKVLANLWNYHNLLSELSLNR